MPKKKFSLLDRISPFNDSLKKYLEIFGYKKTSNTANKAEGKTLDKRGIESDQEKELTAEAAETGDRAPTHQIEIDIADTKNEKDTPEKETFDKELDALNKSESEAKEQEVNQLQILQNKGVQEIVNEVVGGLEIFLPDGWRKQENKENSKPLAEDEGLKKIKFDPVDDTEKQHKFERPITPFVEKITQEKDRDSSYFSFPKSKK